MHQSIITLGMMIGGIGLFLLAVNMITDGLRLSAGKALRNILTRSTSSPKRGIASGVFITGIVQSSSAVTVATIGFVNAGLLTIYQALGVVYGANIGTTMTGWLVALVGFKISVASFALPMVGIGMLMRLTGGDSRRAPLGMVLAGFGLFFIGIDTLKDAFEGMAAAIDLHKFTLDGITGVLLYTGIGFLITVLTQSSSAAIAITLTAATGGVLGLYAAAAMVIGANVGTTSTAGLAVIGATPNAKRVAAAHVIFNLLTGVVALLMLPLLFLLVKTTGKLLGLEEIPAVTLALFHTSFNILGVLLMWPLSKRLASYLGRCFVTLEEVESNPKYLDKTVAVSPALALNALVLELSRIANISRRMALAVLSAEPGYGSRIGSDYIIVKKLSQSVSEFIAHLEKSTLTNEDADQLAIILNAEQHLLACVNLAIEITKMQSEVTELEDAELVNKNSHYHLEVVRLMELSNPELEDFSFVACDDQLKKMQTSYDELKESLLYAGAKLHTPIPGIINIVEQNSHIRRMGRQMYKAMKNINEIYTVSRVPLQDTAEAAE